MSETKETTKPEKTQEVNTEDDDMNIEAKLLRIRVMVPETKEVDVKNRVSYNSKKWNVKVVKTGKDRLGNTFYKTINIESGS